MSASRVVAVGFAPSWDLTCWAETIEWGQCPQMTGQTIEPAGKALNVCKALNWFGIPSTAAGFWGKNDIVQASAQIQGRWPLIDLQFIACDGATRVNVTLNETATGKQLHLRGINVLPTKQALFDLKQRICDIPAGAVVAFCGAFPQSDLLGDTINLIQAIQQRGHPAAIDTSGAALRRIVDLGGLFLIKPNLDELSQLLGKSVENTPRAIVSSAQPLLDKARYVLVSRGKDGAILISRDIVLRASATENRPAVTSVGCGDFLLAGFLSRSDAPLTERLTAAAQAAAARAWGLDQTETWRDAQKHIAVKIESL